MSNMINGARMAAMAAAFAASSVACKGQADCKTAQHDCKGMNSCKGHGFKGMKAAECLDAKGTIGDIK